jgi:ketosteroid isomerase-like protein
MSHTNERLLRKLFDTFRRGDREKSVTLFTDDAVFAYPGLGALHGEWRGRAGILNLWAEQDRCSGNRFRPEPPDLVAGDRHVFLMVGISPEDGSRLWRRVVAYEVSDGMITGARVFEDDPAAAEAFFSKGEEASS